MGALFVRDTGIVDFRQIAQRMAELFQACGGDYRLNTELKGVDEKNDIIRIHTSQGDMQTRYLIACAGLMSDRIVRMLGIQPDYQIIPFRGEYYQLPFSKRQIIQHLIYPIPDPDLPFLGIHLTRMIEGGITVGPNAVLGLKREGYRKRDIDFHDISEMMTYKGFWNVMRRNLKSGLTEFKNSWIKKAYLKEVRKYYPGIELDDLQPYPAGVRAQAVNKDGVLLHDFIFVKTKRTFHVCNAPSPAATSAIPIGEYIVDRVETLL
jgi:L-2-hydroxyglutarate oxidase